MANLPFSPRRQNLKWTRAKSGHLDQIDTRTDVYALGVILFRLLTGEWPHDLSGTRYDVLRRIGEEEVRRPRELTKNVDREPEALLLKALAHDANDRYPSAGPLAQDIENYLTGEPLTAGPVTALYFLRKRIKKYRLPVAVASSALALLVGIGILAYIRVAGQRNIAVQERKKATAARNDARKEADKAKATYAYLQGLLAAVDPARGEGRELVLREPLKWPGAGLGGALADQPKVEAEVPTTAGCIYLVLGAINAAGREFSRALELRRRFLGQEHPDTLRSTVNLAVALSKKDKKNLYWAEPMLRRALVL